MGIIRLPQVKTRTGRSRSAIYRDIIEGTFPRPLKIGARAVGWLESDVAEWINGRPKAGASIKAGKEAR